MRLGTTGVADTRRRPGWYLLITLGAAALAAVSACSSSKENTSGTSIASVSSPPTTAQTSAPAAPGTTTAGGSSGTASGEPYVVGNILEVQTSFITYPPSYSDTPIAFEKWVNDNGGINGHPLKVISIDDHADAAKSLEAAQQLIEQDKVIALVGLNNVTTESAYADYVQKSGVPVIGSAYSSIAPTKTDWFQTAPGSYDIAGYSRALAAKTAGVTKYGIMYCTEVPACKLDFSTQEKASQKLGGIDVVKTIPAAIAAPNYTTPCIQMKSAGVNGLYFSASVESIARAAVDCSRQGLQVVHVMGESGPQLLDTKQIWENGAAGADMTMPYWADVPATKNYHDAMAKYFPKDELTAASAQEWASFEVFKAAMEKVPNDPISAATVKKGLYALPDGFHTDMSVPLHYAEGKTSVVKCFYLWNIDSSGKYELTKGAKYECAP
jgi:branched-chain amino acid transport system substrate-binding protein